MANKDINQRLYNAVSAGDASLIPNFIKMGADPAHHDDRDAGYTCLHKAARGGHDAVIRALLTTKMQVNERADKERHALHVAAGHGKAATVRLLVSLKADVHAKDDTGQTALHEAARHGHAGCIRVLAELGGRDMVDGFAHRNRSPGHLCAEGGHLEAMEALADLDADLTAWDCEMGTPLHDACRKGHTRMVELLWDLGEFRDSRNVRGQTAAHFAAAGGHVDCLRFLHRLGADLAATDANNQTPAHLAAKARKLACMRTLGELGADFGQVDADGETVLDIAAQYIKLHRSNFLSLDTMKLLYEYGAVMTIPVVASMISERDEGLLSSSLRATRVALQHGVVHAKNPIVAALTVSAAFRARAKTAQTIREDLLQTGRKFATIATQLMRSEALDDERVAVELLTAAEKNHEIDSAFEAGAICIALESHDGDFIAQPVVQRLVDKIWLGGDWSLVEFKRFWASLHSTQEFYRYVCVDPAAAERRRRQKKEQEEQKGKEGDSGGGGGGGGGSGGSMVNSSSSGGSGDGGRRRERPVASVATLIPLMQEVAHPAKMRRVPFVQFWYETLLGLVFIFLAIDRILRGANDAQVDMTALLVFIIGNMLYEVGQVSEGAAEYVADVWNRFDMAIYVIFGVWAWLKYGHADNWYWTHTSQQVIALNGFMMCFRLLHVVRLHTVLGPLVLMVLKMFNDLLYFLAIFFILLAGFTVTMHAMFRNMHGYATLGESFLTLFLAALGEFDFEALQESAQYGKYDSTYVIGSLLLLLYLLLATVLLLNLVVAKFSSTYLQIANHSYQEWCLLRAQVVADYHQSKEKKAKASPLCAVPPPLNLLTTVAAIPQTLALRFAHRDLKLIKYCANCIFAVCVNLPSCIVLHALVPILSLMHLLPHFLAGRFGDVAEVIAAAHFIVAQLLMIPFSPLISLYYFKQSESLGSGSGSGSDGMSLQQRQQLAAQRRSRRKGGRSFRRVGSGKDADGGGGGDVEMTGMGGDMGSGGAGSAGYAPLADDGDGSDDEDDEDDDNASAVAAAAVAGGGGAEGTAASAAAAAKAKADADAEAFRRKRETDKLFSRLFSRRTELLHALERRLRGKFHKPHNNNSNSTNNTSNTSSNNGSSSSNNAAGAAAHSQTQTAQSLAARSVGAFQRTGAGAGAGARVGSAASGGRGGAGGVGDTAAAAGTTDKAKAAAQAAGGEVSWGDFWFAVRHLGRAALAQTEAQSDRAARASEAWTSEGSMRVDLRLDEVRQMAERNAGGGGGGSHARGGDGVSGSGSASKAADKAKAQWRKVAEVVTAVKQLKKRAQSDHQNRSSSDPAHSPRSTDDEDASDSDDASDSMEDDSGSSSGSEDDGSGGGGGMRGAGKENAGGRRGNRNSSGSGSGNSSNVRARRPSVLSAARSAAAGARGAGVGTGARAAIAARSGDGRSGNMSSGSSTGSGGSGSGSGSGRHRRHRRRLGGGGVGAHRSSGPPYMAHSDARLVFDLLCRQHRQAKKAAGKGEGRPHTLDLKLLRTEMRPFLPRIPVRAIRQAVYHQSAAETMTSVHTLQHLMQQQQSDVRRLIEEQQQDILLKIRDMKSHQLAIRRRQMAQPDSFQTKCVDRIALPPLMESRLEGVHAKMQAQLGDLHAKVAKIQEQNAELLEQLAKTPAVPPVPPVAAAAAASAAIATAR